MLGRLRRGLTFANVCSFIALVVALGTGGAYAADTVFSGDIVDGEVKTVDIAANAVDGSKVRNLSLSADDLEVEALSSGRVYGLNGDDIDDGGLTGADVKNLSLDSNDLQVESLSSNRVYGLDGTDVDDNGLGGADIYEPSLETVPSARDSAQLGGLTPPSFMRSRTKWKKLVTVGERLPIELGNPACSGNRDCTASLRCDTGDVLLTGGFNQIDNGTRLMAGFPFNANGYDHKYVLHWHNNSTTDTVELNIICADQ